MSDLDDLFDLDELGKPSEEKKPEAPKPKKEDPPAPAGTSDLLSDFDALFQETKPAARPPSAETTEIQEKKPAEPELSGSDDLFEDFMLSDAPIEPSTKVVEEMPSFEKTVVPETPAPSREKTHVGGAEESVLSSDPSELEDLFSDSASSVPLESSKAPIDEPADLVDPSLTIQYGEVKKKKLRIVLISMITVASALGVTAFAMARLSSDGFFGWKWGQKSKDGYDPPSAKVLEQLDAKYAATDPQVMLDSDDGYAQALASFEQILKVDPRHKPSMQVLAETLLMKYERSIDDKTRQTIDRWIGESQKHDPGSLATLRLGARNHLSMGKLVEAAQEAQKAYQKGKTDTRVLTLLGEIAHANGDGDLATQYLNDAVSQNEANLRAKYYQALVLKDQGRAEESEAALRALSMPPLNHAKSRYRLLAWKLEKKTDLAGTKDEIVQFLSQGNPNLNRHDVGDAWTLVAGTEMELGDHGAAISAMENAMKSDPVNHAHAFYLGELYFAHKDFEKAADQLSKAVALSAKNPEYLIAYGRALREAGKPEVGIVEIRKAIEIIPDTVDGTYQLGLTQRRLFRLDEAMTSFETVIARKPDHVFAQIELGELYLDKNNFQGAETQFRNALGYAPKNVRAMNDLGNLLLIRRKNAEALAVFQKAEEVQPLNAEVLSNLGKAYLILVDRPKASAYFEKALSVDPSRVETQIALGDLNREEGDFPKAMEIFRKLIEQNPKNYEARIRLAMCYIAQENFQDAITELQEASKYKADYFPIKLQLGIAWRGQGDLDTSLDTLRTAQGLWPESPEAYYQLEVTYIYRSDIPSAEDAMKKAVKFDPSFIDPYVAMGDFFRSRNLNEKAIEYYQSAVKINPNRADLLYVLAELYKGEKRYALAKKFYLQTVRADPKFSRAYVGLGLLSEEDRSMRTAISYYQKAKQYDPKNPRPYYYLGFIYRDLGNRNAALENFSKYLDLDPSSKERDDILEQIRVIKSGR